jgi:hypothetical protein
VRAVFQTAGYPEAVSRLLAGLCTTATPGEVLDRLADGAGQIDRSPDHGLQRALDRGTIDALGRQYTARHLPQGAPTSPALANLCVYRLDCRLTGLAQAAGASYTRYADDLLFSGDATFARSVRRFRIHAAAIALDEGFQVQHRKTRVMRQGVRQHAAGIVLNARPNVTRDQYDRLKAILTNCLRHGPTSQNREGRAEFRAHLMGCVAHVASIHPGRGARLRSLLEKIAW